MPTYLRADFNGLFGEFLCISHGNTCRDASGAEIALREGMPAYAFDEDADQNGDTEYIVASGTVERSPPGCCGAGSRWCLKIDAGGVHHKKELA